MRRAFVPLVAIVLILGVLCNAQGANRVTGVAYTEHAVEKVTIRVWALGEAILADPAKRDTPLAETTASPGSEFALDLGDAAPPWEVEVSAPGHLAAAFKVILPEQMTLPPLWLPIGKEVTVRVEAGGKPAKGSWIAGGIWSSGGDAEPGRWDAVIPRSQVDANGVAKARVPEAGRVLVSARARDGKFGRDSKPLPLTGALTVKLNSRAQRIIVRDVRGEPVSGVAVATVSTPSTPVGDRAVTNETGQATLQVPADGTWAVVAIGSGVAGRAAGGARSEILVTVGAPQELRLAWSGSQGPVVFEPDWLPGALSGGASVVLRGDRGSLPFVEPGGTLRAWGPGLAAQAVRVGDPRQTLAIRFAAAARIEGAVTDEANAALAGVPVWLWTEPRIPGMGRIRRSSTMPVERRLLPASVTAPNGSFLVAGVTPGGAKVSARKAGMPPAESELLETKAGATSTVTLRLRRGAPLSLQTQDASGRILSGVGVKVFRSSDERGGAFMVVIRSMRDVDEPVAIGSTDREGKLTLTGVPTGKIYLKLQLAGYVTRTVDAELPTEGKDLGAQVLEPGVAVTGRVVDERGQGVADAEITANPLGPAPFRGAPDTRSDAAGFFGIPDQPRQGEVFLTARGDKIPASDPVKVTLPPAGPVELKVRRSRTIEGRVVDERSGDPVAGARVNASKRVRRSFGGGMMVLGTSTFWAGAESDESGAFRLEGADAGACTISVDATGFKRFSVEVTVPEDAPPRPVTVVMRRGLGIHGKVLDASGAPLAGVAVSVSPAAMTGGSGMISFSGPVEARTDPDGAFVADGLDKGRYQLVASDETEGQAREIAEAGQSAEVVLQLQGSGSLQARVVGSDGAPISGVLVNVYSRAPMSGADSKRTDEAGTAAIEDLATGAYQVSASKDGLAPDSKPVIVESGRTAQVELTLKAGGTILGKVIGLSAEELKGCDINSTGNNTEPKPDGTFRLDGARVGTNEITAFVMPQGKHRTVRVDVKDITTPVNVEIDFTSGVTLSGTVRRAGRAAAGVTVQAVARGQRSGSSTNTDVDGAWEIRSLDPGELQVSALNDQGQALVSQTVQAQRDTRVDLEVPGGAIAGRITDAQARQPVPGAQARISRNDPPPLERTAQSDDTGYFRATELPDGGYTVRAQAPGYAPAETSATISMGRGQDVEVALQPEQRVTLVVREADGSAPDRVIVTPMRDGRIEDGVWVTCDREGRAPITTLAPGAYTATVSGRGAALIRFTVPGPDLAVQLSTTGRLDVTTPAAKDAAPWRVRVVAPGLGAAVPLPPYINPTRGEWAEPPSGILRMRLPAGVYTVQAIDPQGGSHDQQVTVPPDGEASARFGEQ